VRKSKGKGNEEKRAKNKQKNGILATSGNPVSAILPTSDQRK
jgi:hypothetical protein